MTGKTMCEATAAFIREKNPASTVTANEIWELSPSGELWPVYALFEECLRRGMPHPDGRTPTEP